MSYLISVQTEIVQQEALRLLMCDIMFILKFYSHDLCLFMFIHVTCATVYSDLHTFMYEQQQVQRVKSVQPLTEHSSHHRLFFLSSLSSSPPETVKLHDGIFKVFIWR